MLKRQAYHYRLSPTRRETALLPKNFEILDRRQQLHADALAGGMTMHVPGALRGLAANVGNLYTLVQTQSFVLAYADVAYLISAVAFALIPFAAVVRRPAAARPLEAVIR